MFLQAWTGTLGVNVVNAPSTQTLLPWPMVLLGGGGGGGGGTPISGWDFTLFDLRGSINTLITGTLCWSNTNRLVAFRAG